MAFFSVYFTSIVLFPSLKFVLSKLERLCNETENEFRDLQQGSKGTVSVTLPHPTTPGVHRANDHGVDHAARRQSAVRGLVQQHVCVSVWAVNFASVAG